MNRALRPALHLTRHLTLRLSSAAYWISVRTARIVVHDAP